VPEDAASKILNYDAARPFAEPGPLRASLYRCPANNGSRNLQLFNPNHVLQLNKRDLPNGWPWTLGQNSCRRRASPFWKRVRDAERSGEAGAGGVEEGRLKNPFLEGNAA
jgi:hypothetical protein